MKSLRLSLCVVFLGLLATSPLRAAFINDALVFYQGSGVIGAVEATTSGQLFIVGDQTLANPDFVQRVVLYPLGADLTSPFLADIFGVITFPNEPSLPGEYLFLISNIQLPGLDLNNVPAGVIPVADTQLVYDATGFLSQAVRDAGVTLQFEHGNVTVPEIASTVLLLGLGLCAMRAVRHRA